MSGNFWTLRGGLLTTEVVACDISYCFNCISLDEPVCRWQPRCDQPNSNTVRISEQLGDQFAFSFISLSKDFTSAHAGACGSYRRAASYKRNNACPEVHGLGQLSWSSWTFTCTMELLGSKELLLQLESEPSSNTNNRHGSCFRLYQRLLGGPLFANQPMRINTHSSIWACTGSHCMPLWASHSDYQTTGRRVRIDCYQCSVTRVCFMARPNCGIIQVHRQVPAHFHGPDILGSHSSLWWRYYCQLLRVHTHTMARKARRCSPHRCQHAPTSHSLQRTWSVSGRPSRASRSSFIPPRTNRSLFDVLRWISK